MAMDLEAIEQIKQLKARYFRYLDTKQWEKWATVFTADAVLYHPANRAEETVGRDAIVGLVSASLAEVLTVHHGHTPEIEILDATNARGIWAMSDELTFPAGLGGGRTDYRGVGHYIERYCRESDGHWRIARIHLRRLALDTITRQRDTAVDMFWD
jgi:hypothetical protein